MRVAEEELKKSESAVPTKLPADDFEVCQGRSQDFSTGTHNFPNLFFLNALKLVK